MIGQTPSLPNLQGQGDIEVHPLDALPELLVQADIVNSCSGSMHALIDKKSALKKRRYRPVLMVDLAIKDIEPNVGNLMTCIYIRLMTCNTSSQVT